MKLFTSITTTAVLTLGLLAACGDSGTSGSDDNNSSTNGTGTTTNPDQPQVVDKATLINNWVKLVEDYTENSFREVKLLRVTFGDDGKMSEVTETISMQEDLMGEWQPFGEPMKVEETYDWSQNDDGILKFTRKDDFYRYASIAGDSLSLHKVYLCVHGGSEELIGGIWDCSNEDKHEQFEVRADGSILISIYDQAGELGSAKSYPYEAKGDSLVVSGSPGFLSFTAESGYYLVDLRESIYKVVKDEGQKLWE